VPQSWSAQFAENSLSPFRNLTEIPWLSSQQSKQCTLTQLVITNRIKEDYMTRSAVG